MTSSATSFRSVRALGVAMGWRTTVAVLLLAAPLVGLSGCRDRALPPRYPVHGQVQVDGKPAAGAMVVFCPLASPGPTLAKPIGYTDAEGRFTLTTIESGDGAMAGDYQVTVQWQAVRNTGEEIVRDGRSLLPARYSQADQSGLKFTVTPGENQVPTLDLKSR